jgi:hypothetical protein
MLRIMTYNVMEGGVVPDAGRLSYIVDAVTSVDPDIVGLQEVLPNDKRLCDCLRAGMGPGALPLLGVVAHDLCDTGEMTISPFFGELYRINSVEFANLDV